MISSGGPEEAFLRWLYRHGPCGLSMVSDGLGIPRAKLEGMVKPLITRHLVTKIQAPAGSENTDRFNLTLAGQIFFDPSTPYWARQALCAALERDPVDAASAANLLAQALGERADAVFATLKREAWNA